MAQTKEEIYQYVDQRLAEKPLSLVFGPEFTGAGTAEDPETGTVDDPITIQPTIDALQAQITALQTTLGGIETLTTEQVNAIIDQSDVIAALETRIAALEAGDPPPAEVTNFPYPFPISFN